MRDISIIINDGIEVRSLPEANKEVMPGVKWGEPWEIFTPAYWLSQAWMAGLDSSPHTTYRAKDGLVEELGFCLLGGFGITVELATAAYNNCIEDGLFFRRETDTSRWQKTLSKPLNVNGKTVHYRYPNQKAKYLSSAMQYMKALPDGLCTGKLLREWLVKIPGVGYKTASWTARNVLDSDDVAILDIHIIRAGRLCGLYNRKDKVEKKYLEMEDRFLEFCSHLNLRPAVLDCLIWDQMRESGKLAIQMLEQENKNGIMLGTKKTMLPQAEMAI